MLLNLLLLGLGAPNGKKLALTCVEIWSQPKRAQVIASQRKVHARHQMTILAGNLWRSDFFRIRSGFCQSDAFRSSFCEVSSDSGPQRKTGNENSPDRGFPQGFQVTKWRALWWFWTANSFNIYFDKGYGKLWFLEIT